MANFISCWSRPDITFTVNKLCKYMANPGEVHWKLLKHLLRYLSGTRDLGLYYAFENPALCAGLHGYTDSSFADCPDTSRSTLAYAFFFDNAIVSWYSKLGSFVTTCTNHAEYNALALGAKEAEWLVSVYDHLIPDKHTPVPIFVDNSGVISMVYNPVDHQANKHVRVGCHYSRELAERKVIIPQRVPSETNIADLFTKPLGNTAFNKLSALVVGSTKPLCVTTLMFSTEDADNDCDSESEAPVDDFRKRWTYLSKMKTLLGAASYSVLYQHRFSHIWPQEVRSLLLQVWQWRWTGAYR